jgi:hypothetical protein
MQLRRRHQFTTIRTEGSILPADLLQRINEREAGLAGLKPEDYHLPGNLKLNEAINQSWNRLLGAWTAFHSALAKLPDTDPVTTLTREKWLLPVFNELGYGRLLTARAIEIDGRSYPVSHGWQHTPLHLVGAGIDLDKRTAGIAGAARMSPHGLVQELLNRSETHFWGMVSNGLRLRILRDNVSLTRQAYVEFDLEAMMNGELYADFALFWLLCHESRVHAEKPQDCWLEKWSKAAQDQGTRALEQLRRGVEEAIEALGRGFLAHPSNHALVTRLRTGALSTQDYYRQLLRLVYRLLFLFVAEDRDLLLRPNADPQARQRYERFYSLSRLRHLAEKRVGTRHADLYHGLRIVMAKLGSDAGCPELALPALGSFLFSREAIPDLEACDIANAYLLDAVRALAFINDRHGRRLVDYKNLRSEELGSVYEALLELLPDVHIEARQFDLKTVSGSERKSTGSYYTPESLVQCLLDSALEPVVAEALKQPDAAQAILRLKVCDPACGSGHFLIAAAHRLAKHLASVRTGDDEPAPEAVRTALRDVIGHCLYGVDINPMAVELCKVSLWMEALEPGKPLSFLDHRIQCGNSLIGATPALLKDGIPDDAFKPIEGDDRAVCSEYRKHNKQEREGQQRLFAYAPEPWARLGNLATGLLQLEEISDDSIAGVRRKQERWEQLVRSQGYVYSRLWADAWYAAFVWKKVRDHNHPYPITEELFRKIERNPFHIVNTWHEQEIRRLAEQYQFFHWHLAFPDVFRVPTGDEEPANGQAGWNGGFDIVVGNPPWEKIQIEERLFFSGLDSDIAEASAAKRKKLITELAEKSPELYHEYTSAMRKVAGQTHLLRDSDKFPLAGKGNISTHSLFIELAMGITGNASRVGLVVPSGLATQDSQKELFGALVSKGRLRQLYDFENSLGIFPGVHRSYKFCLCIIGPPREDTSAEFAFYLHSVEDLKTSDRVFPLTHRALQRISPNTLSCPTFRNRNEARIYDAVCQNSSILLATSSGESPWGWRSWQMFNETHEAGELVDCTAVGDASGMLRLYEAKLFHQFDHRYATFEVNGNSVQSRYSSPDNKCNPLFSSQTRYYVPTRIWEQRVAGEGYNKNWIVGFRKIARATDERTAIFSILPQCVTGSQTPVTVVNQEPQLVAALLANLNSFVFDFAARQRVGGTDLNHFIIHQLPVIMPTTYLSADRALLQQVIVPHVLELTYTAYDLKDFATDCGYTGEPFRWDEERRFLLRCELDAAYFHLYGIGRDDVDYILETFPIVKRKDEQAHGEYRTKRVILDIYDAMQQAIETGTAYHTRLDPPPTNAWTPPEITLEVVTGRQSDGAKDATVANSLDDVQRCAAISEIQPKLHFASED